MPLNSKLSASPSTSGWRAPIARHKSRRRFAKLGPVSTDDFAPRMFFFDDLDRGIAEHAAAIGVLARDTLADVGEQRVELRARVALMLRDDGVPPVPEALRLILEDFDDEVFLRLEHAIEGDLGRVGFRRDRVDAHAANAESIEELLRRIEDSIARAAAGVARFVIEERRVRRKFVLRG